MLEADPIILAYAFLNDGPVTFVRGRSFQRVNVLAVEHELTSLVMHRRPRGYDARVSLRCQRRHAHRSVCGLGRGIRRRRVSPRTFAEARR